MELLDPSRVIPSLLLPHASPKKIAWGLHQTRTTCGFLVGGDFC